jgi:hypothetical protein
MPSRQSSFEKWKQQRKAELTDTLDSIDDLIKLMMSKKGTPKDQRVINPTQRKFIEDPSRIKAYMGPGGSGKTVVGCTDQIVKALTIPGYKGFIGRRDYNDLIDTTGRTATEILNNLPDGILLDRKKAPPMQWWLKPIITSDNPMPEPSEITFIGLSDWLGSYEYTGGFVDEMDEVEEKFFFQMLRAMRYKPPGMPDFQLFQLSGSFNPPSKNHWLFGACTGVNIHGDLVNGGKPVISLHTPEYAENQRNLRSDYYTDMEVMPMELQQRYRLGQWVDVFPGDPVIRQFREQTHVSNQVEFKNNTLFRFWDFGYNRPAVIYAQLNTDGRMQIMDEYMGKQIEGSKFIEVVNQHTGTHFGDCKAIVDYGDPAVAQHKDTGSMLTLLQSAGINLVFKRTPFDVSLALLRKRFETLIEGHPAILIHPRCKIIIAALKGGYHLKEDGETPKKDGYYDHLMDALRYGVFNIYGAGMVNVATASEAAKYTNARTVWQTKRY